MASGWLYIHVVQASHQRHDSVDTVFSFEKETM